MPKQRYFDYAATTPLDPKVLSAMLPYFKEEFGNPSNLYALSRRAKEAIEKSSKTISGILKCRPEEIFYTGSATESDNLAILGVAKEILKGHSLGQNSSRVPLGRLKTKPLKIITSEIEHKGVLAICDVLSRRQGYGTPNETSEEKDGFEIVKLPVLKNGLVDLNELKRELDDRTILVSITMADSETGTIQPISEISKIIKNFEIENLLKIVNSKLKIYFHTDASQSAGYLDIDVNKLGVDLMTFSAHKLYGPKGIGGLYVRRGTKINPIIYGGGQQNKLRSGTENVPGIIGFAQAMQLNNKHKKTESARIKKLRDTLEKGIFRLIPKVVLNGHPKNRLPNFLNISILDVEGEALLLHLDELGIMVSTGSACNSQSLEPSYILQALGRPYEHIHGSVRFSLGKKNTMQDVNFVLKHLPLVVKKLRNISPLNLNLNQTKKISDPRAFIGNQTPHFLRPPLRKSAPKGRP